MAYLLEIGLEIREIRKKLNLPKYNDYGINRFVIW